jgi:hypothetical protein
VKVVFTLFLRCEGKEKPENTGSISGWLALCREMTAQTKEKNAEVSN